ncbi:lipoprotein [Caballeronia arvi]|uniref:Lipoprotein n=1 Tax=Caballeronia arvi TaxID=1777135 RepID=A0A158K877_9BURK|nr:DUF6726 family protein [Caballeronia arvi]SAL76661.1 lipoprotein [Caballeronia arvi]
MPTSFRLALACVAVAACPFMLDGCALAALPCRATSAVLKVVPVVGHAASTPFDACATAID